MSSRRILASIGGMAVIFSFTVAEVPAAIRDAPSQSQPRDPRPVARDLSAERAQFDKLMAALEQAAAENPTDAAGYQLIATHYWEKAYKDAALSPADKLTYIDAGIRATDRALAQKPEYLEALVYKNLLLRLKANMETDPVRRQELIAEADKLRNQAIELKAANAGFESNSLSSAPAPPPPPAPPGCEQVDGLRPLRVGGHIKPPTKIHDVRPIYPKLALDDHVSGVVILEALIDTQGRVSCARVLRSIPLLDQAAVDAVRQWEFTPTLFNGVPVPVMMTVTVNFALQ